MEMSVKRIQTFVYSTRLPIYLPTYVPIYFKMLIYIRLIGTFNPDDTHHKLNVG